MGNKNVKYWDDLSQQEKDLAIAFGIENEYSSHHEKPNHDENLSYEKREDVPEQAKELWDMIHN